VMATKLRGITMKVLKKETAKKRFYRKNGAELDNEKTPGKRKPRRPTRKGVTPHRANPRINYLEGKHTRKTGRTRKSMTNLKKIIPREKDPKPSGGRGRSSCEDLENQLKGTRRSSLP